MSNASLSSAPYKYSKEEFTIRYDLTPDSVPTVVFQGRMRLEREDEAPISELLARVIDKADKKDRVTLDLRPLAFINSRGISILFKFAIDLRNKSVSLNVLAIKSSVWQQAQLNNIPKLSPDSIITWSESGATEP